MIDATETLREPPAPAPSTAATAVESLPVDIDGFLASVERRAFRLAELALGDREDALDAVQDAMIKLVRYRGRPAGDWSPLFWSILRRQLTDRHRRNAVKRRVMGLFGVADANQEYLLESHADPGQDPAGRLTDLKSRHALGRGLRELPRRQRECFLLRELQGLSVAETALAMGCSGGSRFARRPMGAMALLASCLVIIGLAW